MKPRQQRMLAVGLALLGIAIAAGLTFRAFDENMMFFVEVSDVVAGNYPVDRSFRIGGLVVAGVLPDLFREGQGVVAHGEMVSDELFVADKILAKHDENYMAPEVAESLAKHVQDQTTSLQGGGSECDPK